MIKTKLTIAVTFFLIGCSDAPQQNITDALIKKSERIEINDQEKYMIFTDKGVFENTDSAKYGKYNSADIYADIQVGSSCDFLVVGERNPKRSTYQNIIQYECE